MHYINSHYECFYGVFYYMQYCSTVYDVLRSTLYRNCPEESTATAKTSISKCKRALMHRNEHKQKCNQQHKEINKWSNQQSCKLDEYDSDTKDETIKHS
jgi:uncharacterized protein YjaG (DUF416 family)